MKCMLEIMLFAPDDELAKHDECYARLFRDIVLPYSPSLGMLLELHPIINDRGVLEEARQCPHLSKQSLKTQIYCVEEVSYSLRDGGCTTLNSSDYRETIDEFRAYIALLVKLYGFTYI